MGLFLNKLLLITNGFLKRKKNSLIIVTIVSLSILAIVSTLNIIKSNEQIMLDELYNTYGSYTISIQDESAINKIEVLKIDDSVKNVFPLMVEQYDYESQKYCCYYTNEDVFSQIGVELIDGSFPKKSNEIAVERSVLFKKGITSSEMIGCRVNIPTSPDGNEKEYIVTGIVQFNSASSEKDELINILLSGENDKYNRILIQIDTLENYEDVLDKITTKYEIDKEKCYINFDLFMVIGILTDENVLYNNTRYYVFVYIIIFFGTIISLYNVLKLFINDVSKDIAIINLVGVSKKDITASFLIYLFSLLLIGIMFGLTLSFSIALPFVKMFLTQEMSLLRLIQCTRFDLLALSIMIYIIITLIIFLPSIFRLHKLSASNLIRTNTLGYNKETITSTHLFGFKKSNYVGRIAIKNVSSNKFNTIVNVCAIALTISILVVGLYFVKLNLQVFGYSNDFDYKIEYDIDGDKKQQEEFYKLLLERDDVEIHSEYISHKKLNFERDNLEKKYIDYLSKDISDDLSFIQEYKSDVKVTVIMLGYNQEQVSKLCEVNNIDNIILKNNDAIILTKTIPLRGNEGFNINVKPNSTLSLVSNAENNTGYSTVVVKALAEKLYVYPNGYYNEICVIVTEEFFKELTGIAYPNTIYLNVEATDRETIEKELIGNDFYTVSIPKEQERYLINANNILSKIVILLFVIILLTVLISVFSSLYIRIYLSIYDYISYKSIGISSKRLSKIVAIEMIILFGVGVILAFVLSRVSTFYSQNILLGEIGEYLYVFPIGLFTVASCVCLLLFIICSIPVMKKIYRINIIEYLKEGL